MNRKYTNLEMLIIGIEEIAQNHGFKSFNAIEEDRQVGILGGNIPTLSDVYMLCENIGIDYKQDVEEDSFGITVWISDEWFEEKANSIYEPEHEMWRKNQ